MPHRGKYEIGTDTKRKNYFKALLRFVQKEDSNKTQIILAGTDKKEKRRMNIASIF